MIQKGTYLNVIDNSGAKEVCCIHVPKGYRKRYAHEGDVIVGSIKSLRKKRRAASKLRKGDVIKVLIVRVKKPFFSFNGFSVSFFENACVVLNSQNKSLGTRIFGSLSRRFRYTKFLRILSLSSGVSS
jgi:large subunit ribosomal protein L14